jgi:hypothetical protein
MKFCSQVLGISHKNDVINGNSDLDLYSGLLERCTHWNFVNHYKDKQNLFSESFLLPLSVENH